MKNTILIGKFNKAAKDLGGCLSPLCHVQFCPGNQKLLEDMLHIAAPDLCILLLQGMSNSPAELFSFFNSRCPKVPVIAVGTKEDRALLSREGCLPRANAYFLEEAGPDQIMESAKKVLHAAEGEGAADASGVQPSVLLVDDNPQMLYTLQAILSKRYQVTFATSGSKAFAAISKKRPDIILLDYEMPVCDGKMMLEMLRSDEATMDIPVVFLTGIAEKKHVMEVMSLHPEGYLLKTCSEERLFATIEDVLNGKVLDTNGILNTDLTVHDLLHTKGSPQ